MEPSSTATVITPANNAQEVESARKLSANAWTVGVVAAVWTIAATLNVMITHKSGGGGGGSGGKPDPRVLALCMLFFSVNQLMNWTLPSFDLVMNLPIDQVVSSNRRALTYWAAYFGGMVLFLHLTPDVDPVGLLAAGFAVQVGPVAAVGVALCCRFS